MIRYNISSMRTRFPIVAALALALAPSCGWAAALFDQGPVELRAFRNPAMAAQAAHPVATENLFGFVLGSDIDAPGTLGVDV